MMMKVPAWMAAGAMCGLTAVASAETATEAQLRAQVDALEKRLSQVESKGNENWLNERRAEEVKALIQDVLADADTRASLLQDGMTAGHNGKAFFLASADGKFLLNIGGQIQFRYILNFENTGDDEDDSGFQARRTKFDFNGFVDAGLKWEYTLVYEAARATGNASLEDVIIGTKFSEQLGVKFGHFKLPFLREELNSSKRLLTVERAQVTEFFTFDRAEQIQLGYTSDLIRGVVAFSDGAQSGFSDIGADNVEVAVTGRADVRLAGDWKQMDDVSAWSGEPFGLFLGGAAHFQSGDSDNAGVGTAARATANYFAWTLDASLETNGLGVMAAVMGGHIDSDSGAADRDMLGFLVQAGFFVIPDKLEPFARFEWLDDDDVADATDEMMVLTFGMNYYFKKHNAKLTVDVLWWLDGDAPSANPFGASATSSGLGFSSGGGDAHGEDNVLVRIQFQLLF